VSSAVPPDNLPSPVQPAAKLPGGKLVEYDQYIDTQLRRTRGQVKIAEVCSGLMSLAVAALAFFLVVAVADHWLFRGGFGGAARFVLFGGLVIGAGYYFVKRILPALLGRVNPVYAAQTIERSRPTLKNSLINFLLFRQKPESVPGVVYKALQEQAATGLTRVSIESAVDRTRMIHLGYVLIGFLTAFALYFVLSSKNPFVSAQRIILPWTDVPAPSRVSIQDIQPREATIFRGQSLPVSAIIDGLATGDVPQVLYTTADRQIVDRGIPLTVPQGYRHVASLPESKEGLQQDVAYRIEAGDAISGTFRVHVIDAPTIVVDRVEYKYPAYTGMEPYTVEHHGDIKALEGTQVTIHGTANQPIKSGYIDFGCDHKPDVKLKVDGKTAKAGFVLSLDKDRKGPLYDSYQLLITNDRNMENAQPIQHRIEVIADLAPEVAILAPEREEVSVPLDGQVTIELRARDPDFALSGVELKAKTDRGKVLDENLLSDAPHQGPFTTKYQFVPAKLGLKPGDVVAYQAIATDNKTPEANETATSEKRIKIAAPENPNPPPQANQQPRNGQNNREPNNQQQNNDRKGGQSKNSDNNKSEKGQSKGSDGQRGDRQEQNNDQKQGADQKQQSRDAQKQSGDQPADGQQKQNGNQPGSDQQNAGDQKQQGDSKQADKPQKDDEQKQPSGGQQGQAENSSRNGQSKDDGQQQSGGTAGKSEGAKGSQQGDRSNQDQSKNDAQGGGQHNQSEGSQNQPNSSQQQPDGTSSDSSGQPNKDQGQGTPDKGQAKGKGQSAKDQSQSRAPADGQDDGNALERILNHDQKDKPQDGQKGQSTSGQNNQPSPDQKNQSADNQNSQSPDGQKRDATQPSGQQEQPGNGQDAKQQTGTGQATKDKEQGTKDQQAQNAGGQKRDATQPGDQQKRSGEGQDSKQQTGEGQTAKDRGQGTQNQPQADQSTKSDQGSTDNDKNEKKDGGSQGNPSERPSINQDKTGADQSPSASRDNSNSNSGAGQKNQDGQGSPENQRDANPRDKTPDPASKSSEPSDAQSPGTSQHESDSRGYQGGDQSGGGQSGGGQKADKPGKGQSGQNTASDQGAGKSSEPGKGEDSSKAGTDKKSDQATGQSGDEKGNGSKSQSSQQGDSKQGPKDQGEGAKDKPQGANDQGHGTNDKGQPKGEQGERTNRGGGSGNSGNIDGSPPTASDKLASGPAPPIEDPNLAYAKKATELALDRLKKALKASDNDNLLRDLGWSRTEAEEFVKRQEDRLQNANLPSRTDDRRRQAEDDLRSLGLRPDRTTRAGGNVTSDNTRGLSSDRRTAPPPEYAQQFKAYQQGVNQSGQTGK
jgi:hypothetical protein